MYFEALSSHKKLMLLSEARPSRHQDSRRSYGFSFPAGATESKSKLSAVPSLQCMFLAAQKTHWGSFSLARQRAFSLHSLCCLTLHILNKLKEPSRLQQLHLTFNLDFLEALGKGQGALLCGAGLYMTDCVSVLTTFHWVWRRWEEGICRIIHV